MIVLLYLRGILVVLRLKRARIEAVSFSVYLSIACQTFRKQSELLKFYRPYYIVINIVANVWG